jgi:hypothetical protein
MLALTAVLPHFRREYTVRTYPQDLVHRYATMDKSMDPCSSSTRSGLPLVRSEDPGQLGLSDKFLLARLNYVAH